MSQGTVTVADDGTVTSSGLAGAIYTARVAMLPLVQPPGQVPAGAAGVPLKRGLALDANALASALFGATLPAGIIAMYGAASPPAGWLVCNGASVSRTTYAALFVAIGTTYGFADGSHFNLPDLRGRVPLGAGTGDASDATAHTMAQKGGAETHTLSTPEMPAHTHGPGAGTAFVARNTGLGAYDVSAIGSEWDQTVPTTASTGGGGAHNNMQPYLGVNFIIKY